MEDAYQAGKVIKEAADAIFAANVEEKAKAEKQVKGMRNILEKSFQKGMVCVGAAVFLVAGVPRSRSRTTRFPMISGSKGWLV